jgi:GT2 family glycosyltransferase
MFYDPDKPVETPWIMWLDDDSHIVDPMFLQHLGAMVDKKLLEQTEHAPRGHHCFGKVYYFHYRGNQIKATHRNSKKGWVEKASWYTGRPHHLDHSKKPPMPKSDFCTGGFWLVTREAVLACGWPDPRIRHRGGDIMFGAALQQQGFGVAQVHEGVRISDAKKRGFDEPIAGIE